jgi:RimJ/RimL family protein N-acetyltransferase
VRTLLNVQLIFPDPPLAAGGIVLRRPVTKDVPWITETCRDPEMTRYIPMIPQPYSAADAHAFIEYADQSWADGGAAAFVIARAPGGYGLGMTELYFPGGEPGLASGGYWLRHEARGQGAATVALGLVAGWAFGTLGVERLQLVTVPDNMASQRVARRAGFTREGLMRALMPAPAGRRDCVMFSLLPGDAASRS